MTTSFWRTTSRRSIAAVSFILACYIFLSNWLQTSVQNVIGEHLRRPIVLEPLDCTPRGWKYSLSLPTFDQRANVWRDDLLRIKTKRQTNVSVYDLCGYGADERLPMAKDGEIFVDVGANVGMTVLPYASRGWTVYAFEPIAINLEALRANVARNQLSNVRVLPRAASNWTGKTNIFVPTGREDNAALAGADVADKNVETKMVRVESVSVTTVDDALLGRKSFQPAKVKVIKIDAQGHESAILRGMKRLLEQLPDDAEVIAEYAPDLQAGHSGGDLLSLARSFGLDVYCRAVCVSGSLPKCEDVTLRKRKKSATGNKPCSS